MTDIGNNLLKLILALLKHQAKNILGEETLSVAAQTLVDIGGEKAQASIESMLGTHEVASKLLQAAKRADDCFHQKCDDQELRGAFTIPMGDLPSVQSALRELPTAIDEEHLLETIKNNLQRDFPNLTKKQIELGSNIYAACLRQALLPLENYTLQIIGQAALRSETKLKELGLDIQEIKEILLKQNSELPLETRMSIARTAPISKKEKVFSNLLHINHLPERIFSATISTTSRNSIFQRLLTLGFPAQQEFILKRNSIISFHNLRNSPWNTFCNPKIVKDFPSTDWLDTEEQDKLNDFLELLRYSLTQKLEPKVVMDDADGYYYFAPTKDLSPIELQYQSLKRGTSRWVFRDYTKQSDNTQVAYYRHSAFYAKFHRFEGQWYLEITPHYRFTTNGYKVSRFKDTQLKKIKQLELNPAVLGQVVMWAEHLRGQPNLFETPYPFLGFGNLVSFDLNIGIDDDNWLNREDKDNETLKAMNDSTNELPLFSSLESQDGN
ncbi:MAG TPA: hypothetical protein V6D48_10875 [Oculatellaceae cyanobacterium]